MRYVGLRDYNEYKLRRLLDNDKVEAIVLGDPFCQKRMFPYGEYDLFSYFDQVWNAGKTVMYQTPCFLTDKELEHQKQVFEYIAQDDGTWILVQDIGIASVISRYYPNIKMCWSRFGKTRIDVLNYEFINYLKEMQISCIETDSVERVRYLQQLGMIPFYNCSSVVYQSIGRVCYTCYESGCELYNCGRQCLKDDLFLKEETGVRILGLSGHIIGERYRTNSLIKNDELSVGFYEKSIQEVEKNMKKWEEM